MMRRHSLESLQRGGGELTRLARVIVTLALAVAPVGPARGHSPGPAVHPPVALEVQPLEGGQGRRDRAERMSKEVDLAIETLGLKQGDAVGEIGAGDARFSIRFAEVVGPRGRVYANELGASKVRRIEERAARLELANLTAVEGAVDDTKLSDECCDAVMMRMVYHMLTHPEPMARSVYRALAPGGTLLILEGDPKIGRPNAPGVPENRAGMGIDPEIVIDELTAVGFRLERRIPEWIGAGYGLVFRKPRN